MIENNVVKGKMFDYIQSIYWNKGKMSGES